MIVAVSTVWMVQVAIHQVIDMFAMRYGLVTAIRAVNVLLRMGGAAVVRCAFLRIRGRHLNPVVVHMIAVLVMQVAIVKIIGVAVVLYGGVPAAWAVLVAVRPGMLPVNVSHSFSPFHKKRSLVVAGAAGRPA